MSSREGGRAGACPGGGAPRQRRLLRLLWVSIAASAVIIALKTWAWILTGSVGLLSDAAESAVNLAAAIIAMAALRWADKPADDDHPYGHAKAEYLAAGAEGALILVAAVGIAVSSIDRLLDPQPLDEVGAGLAVALVATLLNLAVGTALLRTGREERSIVLEADGRHLLTDVWTSVGVVAGVLAVALTGWETLDPLIALAVALNILIAGAGLVRRSAGGLMDVALNEPDRRLIGEVIARFEGEGARFHALRTRQAGSRAFVSMHVLVPGSWSVRRGHDMVEDIEEALRERLPYAVVDTHLEPLEDPRSFEDTELRRD